MAISSRSYGAGESEGRCAVHLDVEDLLRGDPRQDHLDPRAVLLLQIKSAPASNCVCDRNMLACVCSPDQWHG